jgi:hypothetical protein
MRSATELFKDAFGAELLDYVAQGHNPTDFRAAGKRATKSNPNPTGEDAGWWRAEGPKMVQAWIDWRQRSGWQIWTTPDGEPAIELAIETEVANMPLRMFIDRVMTIPQVDKRCIVDLKAGSRSPESDLQLGVYRLGIYLKYGVWVDHGAYWMARKGELSDIVDLTRYDPRTLNLWFDALKRALENRVFLPHVTSMCRACGLNRYCLAYGGTQSHRDPDHPDYQEGQE